MFRSNNTLTCPFAPKVVVSYTGNKKQRSNDRKALQKASKTAGKYYFAAAVALVVGIVITIASSALGFTALALGAFLFSLFGSFGLLVLGLMTKSNAEDEVLIKRARVRYKY